MTFSRSLSEEVDPRPRPSLAGPSSVLGTGEAGGDVLVLGARHARARQHLAHLPQLDHVVLAHRAQQVPPSVEREMLYHVPEKNDASQIYFKSSRT